jgi:hypothetical protein
MAENLQAIYAAKLQAHQERLRFLDRRIRQLVWGRIGVALITIYVTFLGFEKPFYFYLLLPLIALFLFLVSTYGRYAHQKLLTDRLIRFNELELKSLDYEYSQYSSGEQFRDEHHVYSYDLDLFGSGSLFQYLNRCASFLGEQKLASDLLTTERPIVAILERQEAVKELAPLLDLREKLWAMGKMTDGKSQTLDHLNQWLSERDWVTGNWKLSLLRWVFPLITFSSLLLSFYDSSYVSVFFILFSVQWTLVSLYSSRVSKTLSLLTHYKEWLENYGELLREFSSHSFQGPLLKKHGRLAQEAHAEVTRFSKYVNTLEARMNPIANGFGNGLFSFDLHAISSLESWRKRNGSAVESWMESLAEWDALQSIAHFHFSHPNYTFPALTEEMSLQANDLAHPLIPEKGRVGNSCHMSRAPHVMVITGANMAGKSTFLRAVGVNFVLSQTGAPVCASSWRGPAIALRSGMRTTDSLQDHQSYFFAELKRLESIVTDLKQGKQTLVLLDEILKGTNSDDKQAGSRGLILQLVKLPALVLLATHDVVLGSMALENPSQITAACFESQIKEHQLFFDYRLKEGVAQTRNATFLMRKMNIIPDQE